MKLTKEEALRLHRQMWGDMQKKLGDNPSYAERMSYKIKWCNKHFPDKDIYGNCFLCEYDWMFDDDCYHCPIDWSNGGEYYGDTCVSGYYTYDESPISEILALPERVGA